MSAAMSAIPVEDDKGKCEPSAVAVLNYEHKEWSADFEFMTRNYIWYMRSHVMNGADKINSSSPYSIWRIRNEAAQLMKWHTCLQWHQRLWTDTAHK